MPTALITGGSAGLGRALTRALVAADWTVVIDGRDRDRLAEAAAEMGGGAVAVGGDVADPAHRADLLAEVERRGGLDLLVHNASTLGPLPLRPLTTLTPDEFAAVWATNVAAPLELSRLLLPHLRQRDGILMSLSSDAAIEHYEGWGAYGASKAALDHVMLTLGVETGLTAYAVDPGDMRTQMHQDAFPGEDISDRPLPHTVVLRLLGVLASRPPSGRLRVADLVVEPVRSSA